VASGLKRKKKQQLCVEAVVFSTEIFFFNVKMQMYRKKANPIEL
jgi:hypothetical protein